MGIRKFSLLGAVAMIALLPTLAAEAKDAKKVGLAVANLQANFFNQIKESVEAAGAEKGVKVITVDAKGDAATQVNQIQDLLAQNIDALIYIPAGATAASVPVKAAKAAGVPVINIDRNADGAPGDTFIATNSVESARQVCDWIAKQAGGKGEMLIIHGQKGTTPEVDRSKGCGIALKNYPDIKVVGELWSEGWHQDEGFKLTADLLQAHPKTSIVYEFPCADGDPYYPVPRPENAEIYRRYKLLADQMANVRFVGRLATYRYYNMDQVVGQALAVFDQIKGAASGETRAA